MKTSVLSICCFALIGTTPIFAGEETANSIIKKAIKAHGGLAELKKFKAAHSQSKGTFHLLQNSPITVETWAEFPSKIKVVLGLQVNNNNVNIVQVYDGKKGFIKVGNKVIPFNKKLLDQFKQELHTARMMSLVYLDDASVKLSTLGNFKQDGRDLVGIGVSKKGFKDVNLYFDAKTFLLSKVSTRGLSPLNQQEVEEIRELRNYKKIQGLPSPTRVIVRHDDKLSMTLDVTHASFMEQLDPSTFAKPE